MVAFGRSAPSVEQSSNIERETTLEAIRGVLHSLRWDATRPSLGVREAHRNRKLGCRESACVPRLRLCREVRRECMTEASETLHGEPMIVSLSQEFKSSGIVGPLRRGRNGLARSAYRYLWLGRIVSTIADSQTQFAPRGESHPLPWAFSNSTYA